MNSRQVTLLKLICDANIPQHRDLHENNICVAERKPTQLHKNADPKIKFGFSGLEVALIDYGLSRAKLRNGGIAYNHLDDDMSLFHGKESGPEKMQFDIYRRYGVREIL